MNEIKTPEWIKILKEIADIENKSISGTLKEILKERFKRDD